MGIDAQPPTEDLGESLRRAFAAARRGDVDAVERELSLLRGLRSTTHEATICATVRQLTSSVRAHPSFRTISEPAARAG